MIGAYAYTLHSRTFAEVKRTIQMIALRYYNGALYFIYGCGASHAFVCGYSVRVYLQRLGGYSLFDYIVIHHLCFVMVFVSAVACEQDLLYDFIFIQACVFLF